MQSTEHGEALARLQITAQGMHTCQGLGLSYRQIALRLTYSELLSKAEVHVGSHAAPGLLSAYKNSGADASHTCLHAGQLEW